MKRLRHVRYAHKSIVGLIIGALLVDLIGGFVTTGLFNMNAAQAAVVTVDSTASGTARSHNFLGAATVFISDTTGYIFYRDSNGQCVYSKSTDSGDTWGSSVVVDSQTDCIRTVVWYDQWTPGDSGSNIHIATMDTSEDALFYNRLDTTSDTLLLGSSPVNATANSGQVPTFSVAVNTNAITKATDGKIYLASNDNSDAYVVSCSVSCQTQTNWTEVGTSPLDNRNDHNVLMPLAGGDVMIINRDISANDIRTKVWDGISWDASWTVVDGNADESTEYDGGMSATLDVADNNIYLAYATDNASLIDNDDDIRTAVYDGTDWTVMADVLTNVTGRGLIDVAIALDQNNSDIYVAYTIQDTGGTSNTGNIYYKESTDGMTSWGSEIGPVNTTPGDIRKPALDPNNADRLYVSWWDSVNNDQFGETLANIGPDSTLTTTGTQRSIIRSGSSDIYLEADFVINSLTANSVTSITLTQNGTVDGTTGLDNIKLFYDLDTSAPYDCASESYNGTESQFGSTDTDGFSASGTSTFSGSSVLITTSQTMCIYPVFDVTSNASNGDTVEISIESANSDVIAGSASVSPSNPRTIDGTTTLLGAVMTQTGYHWRNDDGSEAAATSATGGSEDTDVTDFQIDTPIRLRLGLSNEGATSSVESVYQLEFAERVTTCSAISSWSAVDAEASDDWDAFNSTNLTQGADTTNIAVSAGGVTDQNTAFLTPNAGVRKTGASSASTTITETEFTELEFSLTSTVATTFGATYCFRLTANGAPLDAYTTYPEITTADKRDFKVQRGNIVLTDTTGTITAGIDYTAPASSSTAFIRITNTNNTGAGDIVGGGAQDVEETTVYIQNPGTIETSVTFARDRNLNESFVDWEIIEFIAQPDTDNEMIVRDVGTATMSAVQTSINTPSTTVEDDADVVVFITGVSGDDVGNDFYSTQVTAEWDSINNRPVFTREATGGAAVDVSYAVVEYTGINWSVQRVEHTYTAAGTIETESINPVVSLNQAFIHAQKRVGANTFVASFGHEVYLSSIGAVSFSLDSNADMAVTHVSVAWVIENTQTGAGAMQVERQSGDTQGGVEPSTQPIAIANTLAALDNSSIFGNSAAAGTNNAHPRAIAGLRLTSDTRYELWRSDTGARLYYRTEIVQWPVADLSVRQNYYRIYTDNNLLTPDDPWPAGATDLGENTSITAIDNPPGIGEVMRLRMTLRAKNANWPADFYQFKLQYAERVSTCTAVGSWTDVGAAGSGEIWRGFAATGSTDGTDLSGDPPTPGDLLISVSDVAGKLVHQNLSATNTYIAFDGEDVEYDWYLQHNGALADTTYCFRAVETDGTALSGYLQYPQIRTADFTPRLTNWRWYDDAINETPSSPAAALDVAPNEIAASSSLMLRVVVDEQKSVNGQDVKFKLQFSEDITFTNPIDVAATSACPFDATWCFFDGGGTDNATITTAVTGVSDSCVAATGAGCGTQNSSSVYAPGHQHPAQAAQEYSFMVQSTALRAGAVYYFRLFDIASAKPVELSSGASYPAAVGESAGLVFTIQGLSSGTATAGVVTDVTTTATEVNFGVLPVGSDTIAAQRLLIDTNAIEGYQVLKFAGQNLTNGSGVEIANISSSNAVPQGWATACSIVAAGCVGYHTTDATLFGGSARFAATDTYSALHSSVEEIMYSSLPATESHDVVYRVRVTEQQPAGDYSTNIVYIATPVF